MLLAPRHLSRLGAIAGLFTRYGLAEFASAQGLDSLPTDKTEPGSADEQDVVKTAVAFRERLVELGPAYIKLGQLLSSRTDLLPAAYITELSKLQDDVPPTPYAEIVPIVEAALGGRISKLFGSFDEEPLGSASLGQVHGATLRDGRDVVVKVQRPNIRDRLAEDLEFFREVALFLTEHTAAGKRIDLIGIIGQLERALADELDYRIEARNALHFERVLSKFDRLTAPRVVPGYSAERVLTSERIRGVKITEIAPVMRTEIDFSPLAEELLRAYLTQIVIDGHFHADPHPGNMFVIISEAAEGKPASAQLALIDFGMTARLSPEMRESSMRILFGLADGRGEDVAEALMGVGEKLPDFERQKFMHDVAEVVTRSYRLNASDLDVGLVLYEVINAGVSAGVRPPAEFTLLAKALAQLGVAARVLDPAFEPLLTFQAFTSEAAGNQVRTRLNPRQLYRLTNETATLLTVLPHRLDVISKRLADNEFQTRFDFPQIGVLLEGLQKVANRVFSGLVLAGILVASAMLLPERRMLGTGGFILAGGVALYMVATILLSDRRREQRPL